MEVWYRPVEITISLGIFTNVHISPPHPDAAVMSMVCMVPLGHISEKELERKKREVGEVRREIEVSSYYCSRLLIDYCRITSRLLIRTVSRLYSYIRGELAILL